LWEPRLNRVSKLYNDTELVTVLNGMRDIYIHHVNSERIRDSLEFFLANNLKFYPTNESALYEGFSHKHIPPKKGEPYHVYGAAVLEGNEKIGEEFKRINISPSDHDRIGEMLGYPKCCRDFFTEVWATDSIDPIYESALNTDNVESIPVDGEKKDMLRVKCNPYANQMLRYFGIRLTPHLSHSMTCEDTIKMGKEWEKVMRKLDNEATDWLIELLSMPVKWDCYKGVAIIDTPIFRGVTSSDGVLYHKRVENVGWK